MGAMPDKMYQWQCHDFASEFNTLSRIARRLREIVGLGLGILLLSLSGCSLVPEKNAAPGRGIDVSRIPDAQPKREPRSKYGNPDSYVVNGQRYYTLKTGTGFVERGIASWYGAEFHGRRTSSGELYDMYKMTAAHTRLPLPTYVRVYNLENGRTAVVKVNDRGPFHPNRIIDLSYAAAKKLGITAKGTGLVEIRTIDPKHPHANEADGRLADSRDGNLKFFLQVGAFRDRRNAERMRDRVNAVADNLAVIESGADLFRVKVGPLANVELADAIVDALNGIGVIEHFVVLN